MLVLKAHVFVLEDVELVMDLLEIRSLKIKVVIEFFCLKVTYQLVSIFGLNETISALLDQFLDEEFDQLTSFRSIFDWESLRRYWVLVRFGRVDLLLKQESRMEGRKKNNYLNCSDFSIFSLDFVLQELGHLLRSAGELCAPLHFSSILIAEFDLILESFNLHSTIQVVSKLFFEMTRIK